ncbi:MULTISPECIES: acyl-CoA dehydrogenase family protein [Brevibacterium]|uniref:acyl-CoA dehydrogenase family protein n=1 Tax=Brevibacterium TaxID=1696 RepID=UPI001584B34B|nr:MULTISPECIES: acyl-CoA dehydrogenase family protein [Brevibacterium]MCT1874679.1 acyl-CoA dehydrogenase family protein [Brevibacterium luteolum]MCT1891799.1 acyl-CoA dehydrogenase family protein [Brevibacterium luteolum]MCT1894344.1 acyl-CoA dehydrogenase family protein [Brevibacterium luteolum]MCT1922332.1 acyl-CoA dehydrogenase family protein [Brevibacterium luteolum]MCT1925234.1 acyl-CoA dehydrogenase family protein [Brevibacterium luteolum]
MDHLLSPEELDFAHQMREFFRTEIPEEIRYRQAIGQELSKEDIVTSQRILNKHGYAVPNWPVEWGGQDWTPVQRHIWLEEMQLASVPTPLPFNTAMVGPVIATFGSQELKERFLPATANIDIWWSQGFSEPNAGSDLASVKTSAVRKGDVYIVNGQKTWTTLGQYGDWIFNLVRTDPDAKKQAGISFLLIDMKSPGVTVRPIELIDGGHEVNEVFFDNVEVPVENLVGEENKGWTYAKFLLGNERTGIARIGDSKVALARVKAYAAATKTSRGTLLDDPLFAARLTKVEAELTALEFTQLRILSTQVAGDDKPDPRSSVLKLRGSMIQQDISELMMDVLGPQGIDFVDSREVPTGFTTLPPGAVDAGPHYYNYRKVTIYGGSSEVQRSIISKALLGL